MFFLDQQKVYRHQIEGEEEGRKFEAVGLGFGKISSDFDFEILICFLSDRGFG